MIFFECNTSKPLYNDHPWDPKIVAVVYRWSLFRGHSCSKRSIWNLKIVVVIDRWSLFGGGRWLRFDCRHYFINEFLALSCYVSINSCRSESVSCCYKQHYFCTNGQNSCYVGQAPVPNIA